MRSDPSFQRPLPDDVEAEVRELERKAEGAPLAYRARYFNRAGDLCASAGDVDRALRLWGRAIDAYLQVARHRAAAATCRKAIQRAPGVVRARCTLALLSVGRGERDAALRQVEDYVRAARRAGRDDLAAHQLRVMERAAPDPEVRRRIGELLDELDSGGESDASDGPAEERGAPRSRRPSAGRSSSPPPT